ncbi:MAG: antibiotic ABC transporter ATP-binding protein [Ectothiorhodospiraceae bacterium]|nr:antibiotic ABC transporter ATP-binding protein [Ectothiorhodospiraceae bacterium]
MQGDEILGKALDSNLLKRLLQYIRPYRWHVAGAILLTLLVSVLGPVRPYLTKLAIDEYIGTGDADGLLTIALLLFGALLLQGIVQFIMTYFTQWIGQNVIQDIRMKIHRKLQQLALSFFDRNPVGRLVTRTTSDVEVLNEMFSSGLVTVFADIFILIWIVTFMFMINWELALVTLSVLPLLIYGTFLFRKKVREAYRDVRFHVARLNSFTQENVSGMSTVQLYGKEDAEFAKHDEINKDHRDANLRSVFYYAVFFPSVEFISTLSIALTIWYAGGNILEGIMTVGTLVSFIQYTEMFFRPVRDLSEKYNIMQTAMASSERIFNLLDDETIIPEAEHINRDSMKFSEQIEYQNIWFAYKDENYVLRDVSLTIDKGTTVALVGATGSGKTTIINLLSRFYDIQKGKILIDGTCIEDVPTDELRRHIGVVLQDVFLFSGTIKDNITLGDESISDEKVREACKLVGVDRFIEKLPLGYDTPVKERGSTLSVGQKQLLAFARALAFDPEILVLDEATSSVDTESEILIQEAITKLVKDRTSIVIAHRLSTIQNADKIIVMHKGKIRESGTHQELYAHGGIYTKLYQLQYKEQELKPVA